MKARVSRRILLVFLLAQSLVIALFVFSAWQLLTASRKMVQKDHVTTLQTLTENYAKTVSSLNHNFQQSSEVTSGIRDALVEIDKTLTDISEMKIKLSKHFVIKPLARSNAIKKSQKALQKSVMVLNSYEAETQPIVLKSLQDTESTLRKVNEQLSKEKQGIRTLPWHVAGILGTMTLIFLFNTAFVTYLCKQIRTV